MKILSFGGDNFQGSLKSSLNRIYFSAKESWLVHSLVDYYFMTQSASVVGILCSVKEPHDKVNIIVRLNHMSR